VLVGGMGAGKSTVGALVARARGATFADADAEIERRTGAPIAELFARDGEPAFRARERDVARDLVLAPDAGVVALGGGAVLDPATRELLAAHATVVWLDLDPAAAWTRVAAEPGLRPLARDESAFRALLDGRAAVYAAVADVLVDAASAPVAVAAAVAGTPLVRTGIVARLPELVGDRRAALVADAAVAGRVPGDYAVRLDVAGGETAKSVDGVRTLWEALAAAELERRDVVVAAGGGTVTDAAGFAAATFRRGLAWIAVPSTLVGQVDAAIGGKTAINVAAKNDVGAFHLPEAVLCDPALLATLPAREWAAGFAEAYKTALLAGGRLHDLVSGWVPGPGDEGSRTELVRRCAALKVRVVAADPDDRGVRAVLNLGHTIGHGVEAAAGYGGLLHGEAVAVGLAAALWLSVEICGLDGSVLAAAEADLARHGLPVRAAGLDADAVSSAMRGDKKRSGGRPRLVLLEAVGRPVFGVDPGDALLRRAVERALTA
jgi:shikimate kinase/3-dehydroquinate synthase